jgi:hypothetical protein
MSERRMDAYYYEFEPTKNVAIDKILGAVACAGKAYHHTQDWCDIANQYDDHTGVTPIEWIQNAAFEAADKIERLRAALTAMLFVTEQLCETLDVDTYETYIRVKKGKSGETIARRSVAEIVQAGHDALGEEKK